MTNDVKGNKKGFCRYIGSKRNTTENAGLLANGVGNLVTKEKGEVLNVIFTLFFLWLRFVLRTTRPMKPMGEFGALETLPLLKED